MKTIINKTHNYTPPGLIDLTKIFLSLDMKHVPWATWAAVSEPPEHPGALSHTDLSSCTQLTGCCGGCGCRGQGSWPLCTAVWRSGSPHSGSPSCFLGSSSETPASDQLWNLWRHLCRWAMVGHHPRNKGEFINIYICVRNYYMYTMYTTCLICIQCIQLV